MDTEKKTIIAVTGREKMPKYIDADRLIRRLEKSTYRAKTKIIDMINEQVAADVVEVVRCKDCKYQDKGENDCEAWNLCDYRPRLHVPTEDDHYCSCGERKDG